MTFSQWTLSADISSVLQKPHISWHELSEADLLITGGTGFVGRWLLESLIAANREFNLGLSLTVTTRDRKKFAQRLRHLAHAPEITLIETDVQSLELKGRFTHIIHAAAEANAKLNESNPIVVFHTIINGMEKALEIARINETKKVLFLSSGAIYGQQPRDLLKIPETTLYGPDPQNARNTYAEAKRSAENLCAIYRKQFHLNTVSARIFSTLGPFLPLDTHFAAGNFIRDALSKKTIKVNGNGRPIRSYIYPADLVSWLLTLLTRQNKDAAYNIGSEYSLTIAELAQRIADLIGNGQVVISEENDLGWNAGRYVPDTQRIRGEFCVTETVNLDKAILNTAQSYAM